MDATVWAVIGFVLVLAEFAVPQFVVFFFGVGALVNALLVATVPALAGRFPLQLVVWTATSTLSLGLLRRWAARWFRGETRDLVEEASHDAGEVATVVERIAGGKPGRIRHKGTTWQAIAYDETIEEGEAVTILEKRNLTYVVTAGDLLRQLDETTDE